MGSLTFLPLISLTLVVLFLITVNGVDIHNDPHHFCYINQECDEGSDKWPDTCRTGVTQSPIDLKVREKVYLDLPSQKKKKKKVDHTQSIELPLKHLKTQAFFMQNNGHTVNLDFANENEFGDS